MDNNNYLYHNIYMANNINNKRDIIDGEKMKINHKPIKKKHTKQTTIESHKTLTEYKTEIEQLQEKRFRHYLDMVKEIQLIDLDTKRKQTKLTPHSDRWEELQEEKTTKRQEIITKFNEKVTPIDKKLKEIRIIIIEKFSIKKLGQADRRMKQ